MPSTTKNGEVSKEKKRKNLAVLANTPRLKSFFPAKLLNSNVKTVALTRAPENAGETQDICFEAPFTLRMAGHIDMLFFRCLFHAAYNQGRLTIFISLLHRKV